MSARILGSMAARAVGRFNPDGIDGYRAATAPNAPLRATRAEAVNDERIHLDGHALAYYVYDRSQRVRQSPKGFATVQDAEEWASNEPGALFGYSVVCGLA